MALPIIGKIIDKVFDKGADLISEMVTDKDEAARLTHAFRSQKSAEEHEFKQLELEAERDMHAAQQVTIQAELHQDDRYTKQTRPKIARRSFNLGMFYIVMTSLPEDGINLYYIVIMPWTFIWQVALLLFSPALAYMGVRGFEKWKAGGSQ